VPFLDRHRVNPDLSRPPNEPLDATEGPAYQKEAPDRRPAALFPVSGIKNVHLAAGLSSGDGHGGGPRCGFERAGAKEQAIALSKAFTNDRPAHHLMGRSQPGAVAPTRILSISFTFHVQAQRRAIKHRCSGLTPIKNH